MSDDNQKKIFSKNLNSYIENTNKTQLEIANSIGVSPQTFNTWCKAIAIPRMGKVQALADYFGINKSDLIEEHGPEHNAQRQRSEQLLEYYEQLRTDGQDKVLTYAKNLLSLQDAEDAASPAAIPFASKEQPVTMAAHFDGKEYTDEELNEIEQFAAFAKNRKK